MPPPMPINPPTPRLESVLLLLSRLGELFRCRENCASLTTMPAATPVNGASQATSRKRRLRELVQIAFWSCARLRNSGPGRRLALALRGAPGILSGGSGAGSLGNDGGLAGSFSGAARGLRSASSCARSGDETSTNASTQVKNSRILPMACTLEVRGDHNSLCDGGQDLRRL